MLRPLCFWFSDGVFRPTHVRIKRINRRTRRSSNGRSLQNKTSRKPIGSKISGTSSHSRKTGVSKISDDNRVSSGTTPRTSDNKPEGNRISNANSVNSRSKTTQQDNDNRKPEGNKIGNANSVNSRSRTILQDNNSNKPEGDRISNAINASSRTTGLDKNGDPLRSADSRSRGRAIVHIAGSPSTAPGSNAGGTTATAFRMTVSVATTARSTGSASTVSP